MSEEVESVEVRVIDPLAVRRKRLANADITRYRVYRDNTDFVVIEAGSAFEALQKSGIENAALIQRDMPLVNASIQHDAVEDKGETSTLAAGDDAIAAALIDESVFELAEAGEAFEAVSLTELGKRSSNELVTVLPPQPVAPKLPTPPAGEAGVLSPEDVAALLGAPKQSD